MHDIAESINIIPGIKKFTRTRYSSLGSEIIIDKIIFIISPAL